MALRDWLHNPRGALTPAGDTGAGETFRGAENDEILPVATATVATPATEFANDGESVATVADVAVASREVAKRQASSSEIAELERLIAAVLADGTPADRTQALAVALADLDAALTTFRTLVAEFRMATPETRDDRRPCTACTNLARTGQCLAAARGMQVGGSQRRYFPIVDLPQHCVGFAPKENDPDQRSGAERWPSLIAASR